MRIVVKEKRFGRKEVLRDLDFTIDNGQHAAIAGPSGIGKTTLLRIIAGLDHDFDGYIEDPVRDPVILFQEDRLQESLTVLSNMKAVSSDRDAIGAALGSVGLSGEERTLASELSGGMKRKLAIARMLLLEGDMLLDEPFRALDDESRMICSDAILRHLGSRTLIFISHDEEDSALLRADSIIRL